MLRVINMCLVLAVVLGAFKLYSIKHATRDAQRQTIWMERQTSNETENIKLLRAEWSLLTNPRRLEQLARKHLELDVPSPAQIVGMDELAWFLPERPAIVPHAATEDPIAEMLEALR